VKNIYYAEFITPRARANITALADKVGVSRPGIYKSFSGVRRPNFVTVVETLDALGIDIKLAPRDHSANRNYA